VLLFCSRYWNCTPTNWANGIMQRDLYQYVNNLSSSFLEKQDLQAFYCSEAFSKMALAGNNLCRCIACLNSLKTRSTSTKQLDS